MALRLKKIMRKNPQDLTDSKWFLTQKRGGIVGLANIAREIAGRSALSAGDILSVLVNLTEVLPLFLKLGHSVRLDGLGSFRLFVSSEGEPDAADLGARSVKGVRLSFLPDPGVQRRLDDIPFDIE